jgi:UDP-2,3-diacylglucosamine hydrolase
MPAPYQQLLVPFQEGKSCYFASDFHLGAPSPASSRGRERKIIAWLERVAPSAAAIFLVGDLFDFWFEYKTAVPKGSVRLLGTIASLRERGIPVYVFTGNHDIWMFDYLQDELDVVVYKKPLIVSYNDTQLFVAHGDGLGPGDTKFKVLKKVFTYPLFQWMFRWVHPDIGIKIALAWSSHSRTDPSTEKFMGENKEWLYQYALKKSKELDCKFFIFGHRHLPLELPLSNNATYINLGDWLVNFTFLRFDGVSAKLQKYEG